MLSTIALVAALAMPQAGDAQVAVMALKADGVSPAVSAQLTERVAELIGARAGFAAVSPEGMRALLEQARQQVVMGCADDSCIAEIAAALGAEQVVSGRVSKVEGTTAAEDAFAISLVRIDAETNQTLANASQRWRGESIRLLELLEPMVAELFGDPVDGGALLLEGVVEGSRILIDGEVRGTAPAGQLGGLKLGAHRVELQHPDHEVAVLDVILASGAVSRVGVQQVALPDAPPFYSTWWFWTATGVVVTAAAAGGVTAAVLAGQGPSGVNVSVNGDQALGGAR